MQVSKSLKWIILLEITIPMVLLVLGIYNGLMQTLFRSGIIEANSVLNITYYQGLTLHGVINAVVFTTFFAVGFGNGVIAYYLNKTLKHSINWLSFILMVVGTLLAAYAMLSGQAAVLYTFYPPLKAHPTFYIGTALLVVGSWVAFFNWIKPYVSWRKENPEKKTPLAVVGILATFIVWLIATLPVAYEIIVMLIPWSLGWVNEINIMLSRTLFWFFGHPLVYFWLLPVYVIYYVMMTKEAGGKLYSDYAGRLVFMLFIIFSIPVGLHHQYTEPNISQSLKMLHAIFTFGVAVPSLLTAFTLAASLEHAGRLNGAKSLFGWMGKLPYFTRDRYFFAYSICGLILFIFGGITGIINGSYSMNLAVHNTAYLPGHFHMTVAGPVLLGMWAMSLHLMSKMSGKPVKSKGINLSVPYLWAFGMTLFSGGLITEGLLGAPRRTNMGTTYLNPDSELFRPDWVVPSHFTALGGIVMSIAALLFFYVFFRTLFAAKQEEASLEFPTAEAYHDEKRISFVKNFTPWIVAALILIGLAYIPTIKESIDYNKEKAKPYKPENPVPIENKKSK